MKVLCFSDPNSKNNVLEIILENEGYEVQTLSCEEELKKLIKQESEKGAVILYQVSNSNLHACYRSLQSIRKLRAGVNGFAKMLGVIVVVEQSLNSHAVKKLSTLAETVMKRPIDVEKVLKKINSYGAEGVNKMASNDNDEKMAEALYALKNQLLEIRTALISSRNNTEFNQKVISELQGRLLSLDRYLGKTRRLDETTYINITKVLQKAFKNFGWEEIDYRSAGIVSKIETNYEYFARAMEDLIEKLIHIARDQNNLSVKEILQNEYFVVNFAIRNIPPNKPQPLLSYKHFDFCQKVINLHAGDFFIKFGHNIAYITFRVPLSH